MRYSEKMTLYVVCLVLVVVLGLQYYMMRYKPWIKDYPKKELIQAVLAGQKNM